MEINNAFGRGSRSDISANMCPPSSIHARLVHSISWCLCIFLPLSNAMLKTHDLLEVLICFILSVTASTEGGLSFGRPLGAPAAFGFCLSLWEVVFLGSSLVNGMNSGAPGIYFRRGSGIFRPFKSQPDAP